MRLLCCCRVCPYTLRALTYAVRKLNTVSGYGNWLALRFSYGMNGILVKNADLMTLTAYLRSACSVSAALFCFPQGVPPAFTPDPSQPLLLQHCLEKHTHEPAMASKISGSPGLLSAIHDLRCAAQAAHPPVAAGPAVDGVVHGQAAGAAGRHPGAPAGGAPREPAGPHRGALLLCSAHLQARVAPLLPPHVRHLVPGQVRTVQREPPPVRACPAGVHCMEPASCKGGG